MTKKTETQPKTIIEALGYIQKHLIAPKSQFNKFGNYKYRSAEDILDGLKKVMPDGAAVVVNDDIVFMEGDFYIKATATLYFGEQTIQSHAFAKQEKTVKGMQAPQITGATSSYARKYALNGLFAIDDNKDTDTEENHKQTKQPIQAKHADVTPYLEKLVEREFNVEQEYQAILAGLDTFDTVKDLGLFWVQVSENLKKIKRLDANKYEALVEYKDEKKEALGG